VEKGLEQAEACARALEVRALVPDVIYAASLRRTKRFAEIIAAHLGLPAPIPDHRLDELDYGAWAGRSNDDIIAADPAAEAAMKAWNEADRWPDAAGWVSQQDHVLADLRSFADQCLAVGRHQRPLVVSSNGILRFLPRFLLTAGGTARSFKMRTGHLGRIDRDQSSAVLSSWDLPPDALQ
jgi:broad specificity phosphatase PhoE